MADIDDKELEAADPLSEGADLAGWVMTKVERWRKNRDADYKAKWDKFYAIWVGEWIHPLQNKMAERSRLIAPATQNAVDQTVSEMVEATFGRGMWFDICDDEYKTNPQMVQIAETNRDCLIEDFQRDRVSSAVTDVYYNGAIFGTGIAKRIIEKGQTNKVYWAAVRPYNFVIDTAALCVDEALGVAHETIRPKHEIAEKQKQGEYRRGTYGDSMSPIQQRSSTSDIMDLEKGFMHDALEVDPADGVYITEYHGRVPTRFLAEQPEDHPDDDVLMADNGPDSEDDESYTEAIVTIANGYLVLKAEKNVIINPETGKPDRGFLAYQHHKRPGGFWGIGQVEKAFNAQSALDAELRARADSLGLLTYPVVGADATRLPKNLNLSVTPGKFILTNGRPSEIIEPLKFGNLDGNTFQQSADLERMVQQATGANDPSLAVNASGGGPNTTASGVSMQQSSFIKRAKLTMQNVDTDFLEPLVKKSLWAYMTVNPQRYPKETKFNVNSTMSIMAREFEQMQMTNLLAIIPHESKAFPIILQGIVENYSGPSKDKIMAAVAQLGQPDPAQQQFQQQTQMLSLQKLQKEVGLLQAQIDEVSARAGLNQAKTTKTAVEAHHEGATVQLDAARIGIDKQQANTAAQSVQVQRDKLDVDRQKIHADLIMSRERAKQPKAA